MSKNIQVFRTQLHFRGTPGAPKWNSRPRPEWFLRTEIVGNTWHLEMPESRQPPDAPGELGMLGKLGTLLGSTPHIWRSGHMGGVWTQSVWRYSFRFQLVDRYHPLYNYLPINSLYHRQKPKTPNLFRRALLKIHVVLRWGPQCWVPQNGNP